MSSLRCAVWRRRVWRRACCTHPRPAPPEGVTPRAFRSLISRPSTRAYVQDISTLALAYPFLLLFACDGPIHSILSPSFLSVFCFCHPTSFVLLNFATKTTAAVSPVLLLNRPLLGGTDFSSFALAPPVKSNPEYIRRSPPTPLLLCQQPPLYICAIFFRLCSLAVSSPLRLPCLLSFSCRFISPGDTPTGHRIRITKLTRALFSFRAQPRHSSLFDTTVPAAFFLFRGRSHSLLLDHRIPSEFHAPALTKRPASPLAFEHQ